MANVGRYLSIYIPAHIYRATVSTEFWGGILSHREGGGSCWRANAVIRDLTTDKDVSAVGTVTNSALSSSYIRTEAKGFLFFSFKLSVT